MAKKNRTAPKRAADRTHEPKVKTRKKDRLKGFAHTTGYTLRDVRVARRDEEEQAAADDYAARQRDEDIRNTLAIADAAWANVKEVDHNKGLGFHIYRVSYLRRAACQTGRWYVMERVNDTHFRMCSVEIWAHKWLANVRPGDTARHNRPNLDGLEERQAVTAFKLWRAQCEAILDAVHADGGGMAWKWNGNKSGNPWLSTDYLEIVSKRAAAA